MHPSLLPSLAWFARIAHHLSFTRAAEEMGVSRAALSQNLKMLEQELGVKLLYRTTRDMSLTEAGQQLLDTLQPALGDIGHALRNLGDAGGVPSGLLRLNTSRLAAKALIEPCLPEFQARFPRISFELIVDDSLSNIIADGCDAGIRLGRSLADHVVAVAVSPPLSLAVVGSPGYLAKYGSPDTPADLARHNCINYRYPGGGAVRAWDFDDPGADRHFTLDVKGKLTTNDNEGMIQAAVQGLGLVQGVDLAMREHLAAGRLVRVLPAWTHRHAGFYLYTPSREHMPSKVRALRDFLVEQREAMSPLTA
jgi:DNA-binding transcriptional LysR family regulator